MADENNIKMAQGLAAMGRKKKKSKLRDFFKIKDSKQEFTGPKATKDSLGDTVNKFRKMDDDIKKQQKLSKGGRTKLKGGGMSQRGLGRAFMKGGKV